MMALAAWCEPEGGALQHPDSNKWVAGFARVKPLAYGHARARGAAVWCWRRRASAASHRVIADSTRFNNCVAGVADIACNDQRCYLVSRDGGGVRR